MNKNFKYYLSVWAIFFVLFHAIVFLTPNEAFEMSKFGGAFWTSYIFTAVAFIAQLLCAYTAFKSENLKKLFYNLPLITVNYTGLILMMIFGTVCMVIPNMPNWLGILLCFSVLAFTTVSVVKAKLAGDLVSRQDEKIEMRTCFIKSLTAEAESLISKAKSEQIKQECKKVYEAVRYSDPMSSVSLAEIESKISGKFAVLSEKVMEDKADYVTESVKEFVALIEDRNQKCKLLTGNENVNIHM